ncbi:hypothetical protein SAMN05428952_10628 [Nitrosomonas sp. Nm132]|nr:hypothetical protein SAMN05428952_10628 [Nitrosomonas sp. Nm132]
MKFNLFVDPIYSEMAKLFPALLEVICACLFNLGFPLENFQGEQIRVNLLWSPINHANHC